MTYRTGNKTTVHHEMRLHFRLVCNELIANVESARDEQFKIAHSRMAPDSKNLERVKNRQQFSIRN